MNPAALRVHVVALPYAGESLLARLGPGVYATEGDEVPPVDVLVAMRPSAEQLDLVRRALVLPAAGLPWGTRALLLERPHLRVYNIHHNAAAVAESALALLLAAAKAVVPMDRDLRLGDWRGRYAPDPAVPLAGRRAVVLGYGRIGRRVGALLTGIGMEVLGVRRGDPLPLEAADVLVCALPGTPETRGLLDAAALARLPRQAVVVNVGRASVFDERALFDALASGRLHSAGLDVWTRYPVDEASRGATLPSVEAFHRLDNVVLSPHRSGHGAHAERQRVEHLVALLNTLAAGREPETRVDPVRGY